MHDDDRGEVLGILGKNVRRARFEGDVTQEGLATESGVARSHLSQIEAGTLNPSALVILRLARALRTTPSDLLRGFE